MGGGGGGEAFDGQLEADPADPALIAYTSGTTRNAKGVIHSHRTITHEVRQLGAQQPPDRGTPLTAAPVGHFIGMISALLIPVINNVPVHMIDVWDPAVAIELMTSEGICIAGGAPYFVTSLLEHPDFTPSHMRYMKYIGLGGSSVPSSVTRRLSDLGVIVYRSYGSTEHPSVTGSRYDAEESKRLFSDGCPLIGVELRLAEDGEILSRGPDLCMGYTDESLTAAAFDDDGWYHTGDVGVLDPDGYLTITDRKADIIIRGGENISASEVEGVVLELPQVAEAVVVAVPDDRFGERAAAVVRLVAGHEGPTMDQVRQQCAASGLARQKWPEFIHVVQEFPRTASGKIQKYKVQQAVLPSLGVVVAT